MAFQPGDAFLRRLIAQSHFRPARGSTRAVLTTGVFKFRAKPIGDGWFRCSVDHECPENTAGQVLVRYRQEDANCGLGRIRHRNITTEGCVVELRPEYGNEFHCDLDFPDDQEIIRNLTEHAR